LTPAKLKRELRRIAWGKGDSPTSLEYGQVKSGIGSRVGARAGGGRFKTYAICLLTIRGHPPPGIRRAGPLLAHARRYLWELLRPQPWTSAKYRETRRTGLSQSAARPRVAVESNSHK